MIYKCEISEHGNVQFIEPLFPRMVFITNACMHHLKIMRKIMRSAGKFS